MGIKIIHKRRSLKEWLTGKWSVLALVTCVLISTGGLMHAMAGRYESVSKIQIPEIKEFEIQSLLEPGDAVQLRNIEKEVRKMQAALLYLFLMKVSEQDAIHDFSYEYLDEIAQTDFMRRLKRIMATADPQVKPIIEQLRSSYDKIRSEASQYRKFVKSQLSQARPLRTVPAGPPTPPPSPQARSIKPEVVSVTLPLTLFNEFASPEERFSVIQKDLDNVQDMLSQLSFNDLFAYLKKQVQRIEETRNDARRTGNEALVDQLNDMLIIIAHVLKDKEVEGLRAAQSLKDLRKGFDPFVVSDFVEGLIKTARIRAQESPGKFETKISDAIIDPIVDAISDAYEDLKRRSRGASAATEEERKRVEEPPPVIPVQPEKPAERPEERPLVAPVIGAGAGPAGAVNIRELVARLLASVPEGTFTSAQKQELEGLRQLMYRIEDQVTGLEREETFSAFQANTDGQNKLEADVQGFLKGIDSLATLLQDPTAKKTVEDVKGVFTDYILPGYLDKKAALRGMRPAEVPIGQPGVVERPTTPPTREAPAAQALIPNLWTITQPEESALLSIIGDPRSGDLNSAKRGLLLSHWAIDYHQVFNLTPELFEDDYGGVILGKIYPEAVRIARDLETEVKVESPAINKLRGQRLAIKKAIGELGIEIGAEQETKERAESITGGGGGSAASLEEVAARERKQAIAVFIGSAREWFDQIRFNIGEYVKVSPENKKDVAQSIKLRDDLFVTAYGELVAQLGEDPVQDERVQAIVKEYEGLSKQIRNILQEQKLSGSTKPASPQPKPIAGGGGAGARSHVAEGEIAAITGKLTSEYNRILGPLITKYTDMKNESTSSRVDFMYEVMSQPFFSFRSRLTTLRKQVGGAINTGYVGKLERKFNTDMALMLENDIKVYDEEHADEPAAIEAFQFIK